MADNGRKVEVEVAYGVCDYRGMYDYDVDDVGSDVDGDGKGVLANVASIRDAVVDDRGVVAGDRDGAVDDEDVYGRPKIRLPQIPRVHGRRF